MVSFHFHIYYWYCCVYRLVSFVAIRYTSVSIPLPTVKFLKLFEGAVIHGGDFHITINTFKESPILPTVTESKRKKIEKTNY